MLNDSEFETYACINDFANLNGWQKQEVIVGDHPDARIARFIGKEIVAHHFTSHWPTRYPGGYITFQSGKRFDCANQTIRGKSVYLFYCKLQIVILWRRQIGINKIKASIEKASQRDKTTITELICEMSGSVGRTYRPRYLRHQVTQVLSALSVDDLEDLATLLAISDGFLAA